MALPDSDAADVARNAADEIDAAAREALGRVFDDINAGSTARDAVDRAMTAFSGQYVDLLRQSLSEMLQRVVGVDEVRAMPVGPVPLSARLYANAQQTSMEVAAIVREHAQGVQQARTLAMQLYDGYDAAGAADRPLEGRARAELPQALQALTQDAETRKSLADLIERGRAQAERTKSAPLRAAYLEAFDAWAAGKGEDVLRQKLDVAAREKTRYMANRIAQTELARAHQAQVGRELMDDESVEVVEVMLNPMHPQRDICDLHAEADLFGLGPGCYPKDEAPQPPFHPHCWCRLRARRSLSGQPIRPLKGGAAGWLRDMPEKDGAQIMGSRERLQRVLDGESVDDVINSGQDEAYRLRRLGDGADNPFIKGDL